MSKKAKQGKKGKKAKEKGSLAKGLWIAPTNSLRSSLKRLTGEEAWGASPSPTPSNSRLLELADVALGLKDPS